MDDPIDAPRPTSYLRQWREAHGYSLSYMAARTPFGKSTLSRVETGKISYYREILEAYARVIGCDPGDLISRPPGVAAELYALLAKCEPDDLRRLTVVVKELLQIKA